MLQKPITQSNAWLLYLCLLACLAGCAKCENLLPAPKQELPPETQTGEDTFGCLLNGKVWIPEGRKNGAFSLLNFTMDIDPTLRGGGLGMSAYRYNDSTDDLIGLSIDSVPKYGLGRYKLLCKVAPNFAGIDGGRFIYKDNKANTEFDCSSNAQIIDSEVNLTKYDLQNGVFSGTFKVTLVRGTDTLKITQGRFDKKLR